MAERLLAAGYWIVLVALVALLAVMLEKAARQLAPLAIGVLIRLGVID